MSGKTLKYTCTSVDPTVYAINSSLKPYPLKCTNIQSQGKVTLNQNAQQNYI